MWIWLSHNEFPKFWYNILLWYKDHYRWIWQIGFEFGHFCKEMQIVKTRMIPEKRPIDSN